MDDNIDESNDNMFELSESKSSEGKGPTIMNLNDNKAGMAGVDSNRVNRVIQEWSNGSNFHSFQTKRQQRIDWKIKDMKSRLSRMTQWQRFRCLKEADLLAKNMESKRDLSRIIVHIDLDMFFAAVEIKMRPELGDKPIAVGSDQMLATSNYIARQFGVRPGMPGALARKLCPNLVIIKHSFGNYSNESEKVMEIITEFDSNFCCISLDEAYIDLTEYVLDVYCDRNKDFERNSLKQNQELPKCLWDLAAELVQRIRYRILEETQLSASAGIACNSMIAKVCSDYNKPNGQHMIRGNKLEIEEFLKSTPPRKICGIGPVGAQYLTALDVKTCKDLYNKRDIIRFTFTKLMSEHYLRVGLGVGSRVIMRDEESRKSRSSERTVGEISDFTAICVRLENLSENLVLDLKSENKSFKTVTIKLKKITFENSVKSLTLPYYTCDSETLLNVAKKLLETEFSKTAPNARKYRLIGLRVSNLKCNEENEKERSVSPSQMTLSQIFTTLSTNNTNNKLSSTSSDYMSESESNSCAKDDNQSNDCLLNPFYDSDQYECSVCSERFKHKNLFESHENDCIEQCFGKHSRNESELSSDLNDNSEATSAPINSSSDLGIESYDDWSESSNYLCPICSLCMAFKDNDDLNRHIDVCLNKSKCRELTQVPTACNSTPNNKTQKRANSGNKINEKKSQKMNSKKQKTLEFFFHSQSNN